MYLIFDQGGQSTRALVFGSDGNLVAEAKTKVVTNHPFESHVEQSADDLQRSLDEVCVSIVDQLGDDIANIQSAGIVTQRSSLVCWNKKTGKALSSVLSWQDVRAKNAVELSTLNPEQTTLLTGLRPSPHYGASKIRWCLDNLPEVKSALVAEELVCGPLASFLLFYLTRGNSLAVDPANASRTLLWNIQSGEWDDDLLKHFGIPESILPPLQPIKSSFGSVELAGRTIPIGLLNGDQCAAFYGHGKLVDGAVYINVGTGAFVATPWPETELAPKNLLKTLVFDDGSSRVFVAEGTVNGAVSALKWAAKKLQIENYRELDNWGQTIQPSLLFLNGVGGLGSPYWQPDFDSTFVSVSKENIGSDTPQAQIVSVLESIVFLLKVNLESLEQGVVLTHIVLGGGLSASDCFCEKLASLTGLSVFRPNQTELTGRGAAFLLAGQPESWLQEQGDLFEPAMNNGMDNGMDDGLKQRYRQWSVEMDKEVENKFNV